MCDRQEGSGEPDRRGRSCLGRAIAAAEPGSLWNIRSGGDRTVASEVCKEVWRRPGYKDRHATITRTRWQDPEMREKMMIRQAEAFTPALRRTLSKQAQAEWNDPEYRAKQHATRKSEEYKDNLSRKVLAFITPSRREEFGKRVSQSWRDPQKRAARLAAKRQTDAAKFSNTTQFAVLSLILESAGISTAEIKARIPNARGAIEKLTLKGLIEKRGGKYGRFHATASATGGRYAC